MELSFDYIIQNILFINKYILFINKYILFVNIYISSFIMFILHTGKNNKNIEHVNGVFGDVIRRVPDVTEARRVLGWREEMDLKEALRSSMRYFMQQQQGFSGD